MTQRTLPKNVARIVHVLAPMVKTNIENGTNLPMIAIRLESNPKKVRVVQAVEIKGESQMIPDIKNPVPGTGGRAVCVLRTMAAIKIWE